MEKTDIKSLTLNELENIIKRDGFQGFRARQLYDWIHKKLVTDFEAMTNLSKDLRNRLKEEYPIHGCEVELKRSSKIDETVKYLFKLHDGNYIESVLMKYKYGYTLCISSQVGCRMGCRFCASTIDGLVRNLTAGEMLGQIYAITRDTNERVSNVVVMGTGEPLDNYDNLVSFFNNSGLNSIVLKIENLISDIEKTEIDYKLLNMAKDDFYDLMPLYVNFTSGSTGVPKGVVVGHKSVIDFIEEFTEVFSITENDIMANQAPFDFDVSVKDIYSGIYKGAEVCLIPREYFSNPTVLMDYLVETKATILIWAVSAMCFVSIMNGFDYKVPDTIRKVMFSGELMPVKQLNKWKKYLANTQYVNLYGPTEITCNCTYHILDREYDKNEVIPIGVPFKNEKVFLLDEEDKLVTESNLEGEICVSGTCLAIGYFKDKEKTDRVFVQNPVNNRYYERIYRTGDLAKYNEYGEIGFLSRKDFQIKHMGQRIELGDIEVSAMSIEGVQRACSIYDHKHKKIYLFYVGEIEKEDLSENMHDKLPIFMIPSKTIKLDEFPLNKNGKIDRKKLEEYI